MLSRNRRGGNRAGKGVRGRCAVPQILTQKSDLPAKLHRVLGSDIHRLLRDSRDARPVADLDALDEERAAGGSNRRIVCAACRHPITAERNRIEVNGAAEHTCVNPHGLTFHIACFDVAPGCRSVGVPTTDFTWFRGFAWSYALCGACAILLGWRYQGTAAASFFGLIVNRLVVENESED
jgi:hypothetical protein